VKVLLDHCLPRRFARAFPDHSVRTAADQGWERLRDGKLLAAAGAEFDVILTVDKNIKREQNLATLPIAVVVMLARSN
jgi:predicted nuclease of predicted toxin-antitoxin system